MNKLVFGLTALALISCSGETPSVDVSFDSDAPASEAPTITAPAPELTSRPAATKVPKDGRIVLSALATVSEPSACILPLELANGTEETVSVTLLGFGVFGPGNPDTGNMFAPDTLSGTSYTARVIMLGQSCDAFDTLSVNTIVCSRGSADCQSDIIFESGPDMAIKRAN